MSTIVAEILEYSLFDFFKEAIPVLIDSIKESIKETRANEKEESIIENELNFSDYTNDKISDELEGEIKRISLGSPTARRCYKAAAEYSNKWVNFAYWYMTTPNATLLKASKKDREFVNGIGKLAGFGLIYSDSAADLNSFDAEKLDHSYKGSHLILLKDILKVVSDEKFQIKMRENIDSIKNAKTTILSITGPVENIKDGARVDNNGYLHPIFFDCTPYSTPDIKDKNMSDKDFALFNEAIKLVAPLNCFYYFRIEDGITKLYIEKDKIYHATESFVLDNGSIMGGEKVYVLGKYMTSETTEDTIFVDVLAHPDTARYILSSAFNYMTPGMVTESYYDQFTNTNIYRNIDFTGSTFMNNIDMVSKSLLERNLTAVLMLLDNNERLRFDSYVDPSNFKLVSDAKVSSPIDATSKSITDGLTFIMKGNTLAKYIGEKLYGKYNIESGN